MNQRIIFHLDMDAFFASIEIAKNPKLKGLPVIVGGHPDSRGVVSTCSYEARAFGVHSAMSLFKAKKLCPQAIFVQGSYSSYGEISDQIFEILRSFTHKVQAVSIDEGYLDVTSIVHEFGGTINLAEQIRKKIKEATSLNCSIGIAKNKLVAKIASSLAKPNGIYDVPSGYEAAILAPLAVQCIPGVGPKTQSKLNHDGFFVVKDLAALSVDDLICRYGAQGYHLYKESRGEDDRPVNFEDRIPKSIGAETTFEKDVSDSTILENYLYELTEKVTKRLKEHKMRTKALSLKIRFSDFKTITRSRTFYTDTNHFKTIFDEAYLLFKTNHLQGTPLRLIGISLDRLNDSWWQPTFWD